MTKQKVTPKIALITGITGQDGSYLAEFLLEKGYIVHAIKRWASLFNTQRIDLIYQAPHLDNANFKLHYGDLSDTSNLVRIVQETQPDVETLLGDPTKAKIKLGWVPEITVQEMSREMVAHDLDQAKQHALLIEMSIK